MAYSGPSYPARMQGSIATNRFPIGNPANFRDLTKGKYDCLVYQGDNGDMQFMNSTTITAGAWLPTGTIAYIDDNGIAQPGLGSMTATKVAVPFIVKVGTEHPNVPSEKYNAAGGLITLLPLTGYFRLITTVFDVGKTYQPGTLLTVTELTNFDQGRSVYGLTPVTSASQTVVGIVDGPLGKEVKQNDALAFTAYFKPYVA